jgi:hypothetical protein
VPFAAINEQFDAVTKLESSDARNTAALATSLDSPLRRIGMVVLAMRGAPTERERTPQFQGRLHLQAEQLVDHVQTSSLKGSLPLLLRMFRLQLL